MTAHVEHVNCSVSIMLAAHLMVYQLLLPLLELEFLLGVDCALQQLAQNLPSLDVCG